MTLAEKIVVLNAGRIEQVGRPLDLYDDPANQFVGGFVGSPKMNFLAAEVTAASAGTVSLSLVNQGGAVLHKALGGPLPAVGTRIVIGIRPEKFGEAGAGEADLKVRVDVVEHLGPTSYVYANTGTGEQLVIEHDQSRGAPTPEQITVSIGAESAFLFDGAGQRLR
jgi:lactose/L-arabinose transport system ATP-binding protein